VPATREEARPPAWVLGVAGALAALAVRLIAGRREPPK
jgi:hypothetical protein